MDEKKKEKVMGMVRHLLTFFGGIIVSYGLAENAIVHEIVGALITVIGGVWSISAKK